MGIFCRNLSRQDFTGVGALRITIVVPRIILTWRQKHDSDFEVEPRERSIDRGLHKSRFWGQSHRKGTSLFLRHRSIFAESMASMHLQREGKGNLSVAYVKKVAGVKIIRFKIQESYYKRTSRQFVLYICLVVVGAGSGRVKRS